MITSNGGKRFVGDYVDDFSRGDLVLYGENLPHFHMCHGLHTNTQELVSSCEVIQFTRDIFPENIASIPEYSVISDLIERSKYGIKFTSPPSVERICRMMRYIDKLSGMKRVYALMRILEMLGRTNQYKLLMSEEYSINLIGTDQEDPVNKVYMYLSTNFKNEITLEQIAQHVNRNPASLCRYFKKCVQKTIFETLNQIRINFACKLLVNSTYTIMEIAYESGFRNIAHFNRQFRVYTNQSPSQYRALYK